MNVISHLTRVLNYFRILVNQDSLIWTFFFVMKIFFERPLPLRTIKWHVAAMLVDDAVTVGMHHDYTWSVRASHITHKPSQERPVLSFQWSLKDFWSSGHSMYLLLCKPTDIPTIYCKSCFIIASMDCTCPDYNEWLCLRSKGEKHVNPSQFYFISAYWIFFLPVFLSTLNFDSFCTQT